MRLSAGIRLWKSLKETQSAERPDNVGNLAGVSSGISKVLSKRIGVRSRPNWRTSHEFTTGRKPSPEEWGPARGCGAELPVESRSAPVHQRWVSFLVRDGVISQNVSRFPQPLLIVPIFFPVFILPVFVIVEGVIQCQRLYGYHF